MNIFETLKEIEEASGNEKLRILSNHPELKQILVATYDPFKKYYLSAPGITSNGEDSVIDSINELHIDAMFILSDLNDRRLSGNEAIEKVSDYISTLTSESAILFQKVLSKDLRIGISVKSINKVWPGLIPLLEDGGEGLDTFLVSNIDWKRVKYPLLCAAKLDGVRGRYKNGKMYSRQGKIILGLEHIERECALIGSDLDGEIMVNSSGFDSASGLIRNHKSVPEATYHIFDMPVYKDMTKKDRLSHMIRDIIGTSVKMIPHNTVNSKEQLMSLYNIFLSAGYEGIVIYDPDSYYSNGRGKEMMRIVPIKSADCKVIGLFEGKGKFEGTLGGLIVDYKGKECKVGTGFNDEQRNVIWTQKRLGQIAECEFKEESKNGVMRQPRFKGFREDKTEPNWN